MPYKDYKKQLEASRKNYKKNKEKIKEYQKEYNRSEKGKKSARISGWKKRGIVSQNFDELYERFINTTHCEVCNIELIEGTLNDSRSLDHQHASGEIRNILCHRCNSARCIIDNKFVYVLLEIHRRKFLKIL